MDWLQTKLKRACTLENEIVNGVLESRRQITTFGIIMFFNYPIYYLVWLFGSHQSYENLSLRTLASILCFFLIFNRYWPQRLKKLLPIYWYATAAFCLPFFFTFMTLKNSCASLWLANSMSALFFLFLLFDVISVSLLLLISVPLAFIIFDYTTAGPFIFNPGMLNVFGIVSTIIAAFVIGAIFSHNKEVLQAEKMKAIEMAASNVAHELRTPLATIQAAISVTNDYVNDLEFSCDPKSENKLSKVDVFWRKLEGIRSVLNDIRNEVREANAVINMLLMNAKQIHTISSENLQMCSMLDCISDALSRYPFFPDDRKLVRCKENVDFTFLGNKELTVHILFNLIKNALYSIKASGKGSIELWLEVGNKYNFLYFKDTAAGIDQKALPGVFDRFYSKTYHGYGIGLSYCKSVMKSYDGDISCRSEQGEYAEFILKFPKPKK